MGDAITSRFVLLIYLSLFWLSPANAAQKFANKKCPELPIFKESDYLETVARTTSFRSKDLNYAMARSCVRVKSAFNVTLKSLAKKGIVIRQGKESAIVDFKPSGKKSQGLQYRVFLHRLKNSDRFMVLTLSWKESAKDIHIVKAKISRELASL